MINVDIIIPFKDAVNYLPKICDCLNKQTIDRFFVYFVSDHSSDGSIECLRELPIKFNHIILESDKSGPGAARNVGIENSNSDYICFIDADDIIKYDYIERFISLAENESPDIIECMYKSIDKNNKVISKTDLQSFISTEDRFYSLLKGNIPRLSWGKAFKRAHLTKNNAKFPADIYNGEDHVFLLLAYNGDPKISLLFDYMYFWIRHPNSLTNRAPTEKNIMDFIAVSEMKFKILMEKQEGHPRMEDEFIRENILLFSRRLFKEARMLKADITNSSSHNSRLIYLLKERLLASDKLAVPLETIKNDNTSYWADIFL